MQLLVTGGSGFLGHALIDTLLAQPALSIRATVRAASRPGSIDSRVQTVTVGDLSAQTDWSQAVAGCEVVIHCAAQTQIMGAKGMELLTSYRQINTAATMQLARQAAAAGVRRFVFISSIKANGEQTLPGAPFTPDSPAQPTDPYGISKLEAEQALQELSRQTGMELVVIRPPMVYGPGVKGNFRQMMRWLDKGVPLPFGAITRNRRSIVSLANLTSLILACATHPAAAGRVWLAGDGEDLSTTELLRRLATALEVRATLLPVPPGLLQMAASALRRPELAHRLCGSLQVDIASNRALLGWTPVVTVDQALRQTAAAYRQSAQSGQSR